MGGSILDEMGYHSTEFASGNDENGTSGCQSLPVHSARISRSVLHDGVFCKERHCPIRIGVEGIFIVLSVGGGLVADRVRTPEKSQLNKMSAHHTLMS